MLWALHIYIFEAAGDGTYPAVTHTFTGRTKKEAEGYFRSHLKTDSFLRGCVQKGRWQDVDCYAESRWERLR